MVLHHFASDDLALFLGLLCDKFSHDNSNFCDSLIRLALLTLKEKSTVSEFTESMKSLWLSGTLEEDDLNYGNYHGTQIKMSTFSSFLKV